MSDKKILHEAFDQEGNFEGYIFWCEGCEEHHMVWTETTNEATKARWKFNGDVEKPTFSPSIRVAFAKTDKVTGLLIKEMICHSIITDGIINYCGDSTHDLANNKVPLRPFE